MVMKFPVLGLIAAGLTLLAACGPDQRAGIDPFGGYKAQANDQRAALQAKYKGSVVQPEMVQIPAGKVTMGCATGKDCRFDEKPVRQVTVADFDLGKHEVTFDEWDSCFADGGCTRLAPDRGWGRGRMPVIFVSWNEVQQYIDWLNRKTGKHYRLPSEAEFEYALRAGSGKHFWTGDCISAEQANFDSTIPFESCAVDKAAIHRPIPVGTYRPNAFGLHDMAGNVAEWVQDCWRFTYKGLPLDASAVEGGECSARAARGGSWYDRRDFLRSASRDWFEAIDRMDSLGFRLARSR